MRESEGWSSDCRDSQAKVRINAQVLECDAQLHQLSGECTDRDYRSDILALMRGQGLWSRIVSFLRAWLGSLIIVVGAGVTSVCSIVGVTGGLWQLFSTWPGRLGVAGFVAMIVGSVIDNRDRARAAELRQERDTEASAKRELARVLASRHAAVTELFRGELSLLARSVGCNNTDRISLYKHRPDGAFRLVARFSMNAGFDQVHRDVYPRGEGLLALAHLGGEAQYAEIQSDPAVAHEAYCAEQNARFGISPETVAAFAMRSRSYAAFPIPDYAGNRTVAVIVFESTAARRFAVHLMYYKVKREVESVLEHLKNFVHAANENQTFVLETQRQRI